MTSLHGGSPPVGAAGPILRPRRLHRGGASNGAGDGTGDGGVLATVGFCMFWVRKTVVFQVFSDWEWGFLIFGAGESYFVHQYNVSKDSKVVAPKVMSV